MKIMEIKKEFAKAIKAIRHKGNEYPKAMMTAAQMNRHTATVNCGFRAKRERAEEVLNNEHFQAFLKKTGALAKVEEGRDMAAPSFHVRISYKAED